MRSILPIRADSHPYADLGILRCEQNTSDVPHPAELPRRALAQPRVVSFTYRVSSGSESLRLAVDRAPLTEGPRREFDGQQLRQGPFAKL